MSGWVLNGSGGFVERSSAHRANRARQLGNTIAAYIVTTGGAVDDSHVLFETYTAFVKLGGHSVLDNS
jgi:hypothetical protein